MKTSTVRVPSSVGDEELAGGGPRYSHSLVRGLAILRVFTAQEPVLALATVAERLGMSRSTAHRYMSTLVQLDYLEQTRDRKYRLGLKPLDLGMSVLRATGLRDTCHGYLDELRKETGQTVGLATLADAANVVYIDVLHGKNSKLVLGIGGNPALRSGVRLPAHCTSSGKLLLAHLPEQELRHALVDIELTKYTKQTTTGSQRLTREFAEIVRQGYAVSDEELYAGVRSVALPLSDDEMVVATLDLSTREAAITPDVLVEAYVPSLEKAIKEISTSVTIGTRVIDA